MQECEATNGLPLPLGRRNESDLLIVQRLRPFVVVGRLPADPPEQHDAEVGLADQLEMLLRLDDLRGLPSALDGDGDGRAVAVEPSPGA